MSVLDQQSKLNATAALYAPASGGGGGGGDFNNPIVSSITWNGQVPSAFDMNWPAAYTANAEVDCINFFSYGNQNCGVTLDCSGLQTSTNNPGILIQGTAANPGALEITCDGDTAGILLSGPSYLSIDTCIPTAYRLQFPDYGAGPQSAAPTVAQMWATPSGGVGIYDSNASSFQLAVSSILCSTINGAVPGGGGGPTISTFTDASISSLTVSSINGLAPGGGGAAISTFPDLTVSSSVAVGKLTINGNDTNLYQFTALDSNAAVVQSFQLGQTGGRNQLYINSNAQIQNDLWVSSISKCALASVSSLVVSSINGAVPGGSANLNNIITPWVPGFSLSGQRFINVDSNTQGSPIALTANLPVSVNHSYMVSYNCSSGSNADNSQATAVQLVCPPAAPLYLKTYQGNGTYDFFDTGQAGSVSAIVRGASSLQLVAGCASATASTIMIFDDTQQFQITDLGVSS